MERAGKVVAPLPSQAAHMKELAVLLAMHINRNRLIDQGSKADTLPMVSALIVAPTGQGKTYLLKKMAECMDLNVITVDCTTLVGESYKGVSLSQRIAGAMDEAKDEAAYIRSIIVFDEVDKLCNGTGSQASGMTSILHLFNGGSIAINKDDRTSKSIDVSRFAILMGGAFVGLEDIVRERVRPKAKIGFSAEEQNTDKNQDWYSLVTTQDLCRFGLMKELLGRVGTMVSLAPLGLEDYRQLLNAETGSLKNKYDNYLYGLYGVHLSITPEGVDALAQACMKSSDTGARAAEPLVGKYMREAIGRVESDETINEVVLHAEDDRIFLQYRYGEKIAEAKQQKEHVEDKPPHAVKAKNCDDLIRKLCRYYRNACGVGAAEEQRKAFLDCAIYYLYQKCRSEEFTMEGLEKLASVTHRKSGQSTFERVARKSFYVGHRKLSRLGDVYSEWMSRNLVSACKLVTEYLEEKHGSRHIQFSIRKRKKA